MNLNEPEGEIGGDERVAGWCGPLARRRASQAVDREGPAGGADRQVKGEHGDDLVEPEEGLGNAVCE